MDKKLTGIMRLQFGGHKDNAAIGKRLDGPNGAPVYHAEFFEANVLETDDKGQAHSYDFHIGTDMAEVLANGSSLDVYDVTLELNYIKDARGNLVEDVFVSDRSKRGTIHHKCSLKEPPVRVKTGPVPQGRPYIFCLDDAKAAPKADADEQQGPVDNAAGLLGG